MFASLEMPTSYNLSLTAASLRPELARILAELYLEEQNWEQVRTRVIESNLLQCRSLKSLKRLEGELRRRMRTLDTPQIALLAGSSAENRVSMTWLSVCKSVPFVFDFVADVLREKMEARDPVLRPSDYEEFVEQAGSIHSELAALSPSSKQKVRQVLLRMLADAGLLCDSVPPSRITRPYLSSESFTAIVQDDSKWLAAFLVPESEIGGL